MDNYKATKPTINVGPPPAHQRNAISMAFCWWADADSLLVAFESSFPLSAKKQTNKNVVRFGPPLTKLIGSAHVCLLDNVAFFLSTAVFFPQQSTILKNSFLEIPTECQTVWIQIIPTIYNRQQYLQVYLDCLPGVS